MKESPLQQAINDGRYIAAFHKAVRKQNAPLTGPTPKLLTILAPRPGIDPVEIVKCIVAERFGIQPGQIMEKNRRELVAWPRQVCMFLLREITDYSMEKIGQLFGGMDHGTVFHACKRVKERSEAYPQVAEMILALNDRLRKELGAS